MESNVNKQTRTTEPVLILAGTSPQYTEARRKLGLTPAQASWLTSPSNLVGKTRPKVIRFGDWKSLARIREIETALATAGAEIIDL